MAWMLEPYNDAADDRGIYRRYKRRLFNMMNEKPGEQSVRIPGLLPEYLEPRKQMKREKYILIPLQQKICRPYYTVYRSRKKRVFKDNQDPEPWIWRSENKR